jgi:hypothetical protein
MKIYSVNVSPQGSRIVTGSTSVKDSSGDVRLGTGVAVSILPEPYQKRLQSGEKISIAELNDLNLEFLK